MSESVKEIYAQIEGHLAAAKQSFNDARCLADDNGLSFDFRPAGMGTYKGNMTHKQALALVESGEAKNLNWDDKDTLEQVLQSGEDYDSEYDESWQSSFC